MNFIKRFFSGMKPEVSEPANVVKVDEQPSTSDSNAQPTPSSEPNTERFADEPPVPRTVLHAPVLNESIFPEESSEILIKSQPSPTGDQCMFTVNRALMSGYSWYFDSF